MSSIPVNHNMFIRHKANLQFVDFCERAVAGVSLVMLAPLLLAIWLLILLLSRRPPLIAHRRVGRHGVELWVLKFRTMWAHTAEPPKSPVFEVELIEDETGPTMKSRRDSRVSSRFARFCRRHSLDELPQLIHVVLGEMSLVGPRPVTRAELSRIYGAEADLILRAKPGLSGLWQVSGRNLLTVDERRKLDVECSVARNPKQYFEILLKTIPEILSGADTF
jgi:exopolysaccharide production protein ExoY